jgi:hypothetical protein
MIMGSFFQRLAAKYLGPKVLVSATASVVAFIAGWLSTALPSVAPEAINDFTSGLGQILVALGGMAIAFFIDGKVKDK